MPLAPVRADQRQLELVSEYVLSPALQNGGKLECMKKQNKTKQKQKLYWTGFFFLGCRDYIIELIKEKEFRSADGQYHSKVSADTTKHRFDGRSNTAPLQQK